MTVETEQVAKLRYGHTMFGETRHIVKDQESMTAFCGNELDPRKEVVNASPICERCTYSVNYIGRPVPPRTVRRKPIPQQRREVTEWYVTQADGFVSYRSTARDGEQEARARARKHEGATVASRQVFTTD